MKGRTLEEFMEFSKPKPQISRKQLESMADNKLDELMTEKYGYPRFGTWANLIKERNAKIDFIITGDYSKIDWGDDDGRLI